MDETSPIKQSGLGIASLIISILAGGAEFILIVTAAIMEGASDGGMDEEAIGTILLGLLLIGGCLLAFVGLSLGIAGLLQKGRKKVFPVLGTVFNAMILLGVVGLILIGLCIA